MTVSNDTVIRAVVEVDMPSLTIAQNVYGFKAVFQDDQDDQDVLDTIEGYFDSIYDELQGQMSDELSFRPGGVDEIEWNAVTDKWETTRAIGFVTPTSVPANIDDPFPNQNAPCLVANTFRPKTRGRKFIPGFAEDTADGSIITTAAMTALGLALTAYLSDGVIDGSNLLRVGVASLLNGVFQQFRDGSILDVMYTQRRRVPGVGY